MSLFAKYSTEIFKGTYCIIQNILINQNSFEICKAHYQDFAKGDLNKNNSFCVENYLVLNKRILNKLVQLSISQTGDLRRQSL